MKDFVAGLINECSAHGRQVAFIHLPPRMFMKLVREVIGDGMIDLRGTVDFLGVRITCTYAAMMVEFIDEKTTA